MLVRGSFSQRLIVSGKKNLIFIKCQSLSTTKTKKPIILLDVDGVINMLSLKEAKALWEDTTSVNVSTLKDGKPMTYKIVYSPTVIQKINEWSKIAEVRWLTTWNARAITDLAPKLSLEAFKLAKGRDKNGNDMIKGILGKTESAIATAKEVGPDGCVIWIDDELKEWKEGNDKRVMQYVKENKPPPPHDAGIFSRPNTVLLSPCLGLTKEHVAFMDSILADPELSKDKLVQKLEKGDRHGCVVC
jgi:hypothetical protein